MKVLLHMLVDVPGAKSFGSAARVAASLAKTTNKIAIDAASVEEAIVVSPSMIQKIKDAVEVETGLTIRNDQVKRIASALNFSDEMDEAAFYEIYPEDEEI